jgi:holo-[acyl-carrier protein] synthase
MRFTAGIPAQAHRAVWRCGLIVGLGIDVCAVERIEKALEHPRFALRAFTPGERARIQARGAKTAAGIFAAKEAVAKALGSGFDGFGLADVEIVWNESGGPSCRLTGGAGARLRAIGGRSVFVSITHDAGVAAAVAVVEASGGAGRHAEPGPGEPQAKPGESAPRGKPLPHARSQTSRKQRPVKAPLAANRSPTRGAGRAVSKGR